MLMLRRSGLLGSLRKGSTAEHLDRNHVEQTICLTATCSLTTTDNMTSVSLCERGTNEIVTAWSRDAVKPAILMSAKCAGQRLHNAVTRECTNPKRPYNFVTVGVQGWHRGGSASVTMRDSRRNWAAKAGSRLGQVWGQVWPESGAKTLPSLGLARGHGGPSLARVQVWGRFPPNHPRIFVTFELPRGRGRTGARARASELVGDEHRREVVEVVVVVVAVVDLRARYIM